MEGFIHVEINLGKNKSGMPDIVADISDYIPFPDNSVDLIFSKDTMEHLAYAEFVNCLVECHRILKKGGCVRMVVPNFDIMIKQYFDKVHDPNMQSPGMPNENYTDTFIGRALYFDHRYLHNFDTLSRALAKAGFEQVRECLPGDSKIECARPQLLKAETDLPREIIVEAVKSDVKPQVEKKPKIYPKNPIFKVFAKYLNIKITAFTERKARFPHRYWFKTLRMFNKNEKFK
jgi:predicted SAM-dependent methyltransferase